MSLAHDPRPALQDAFAAVDTALELIEQRPDYWSPRVAEHLREARFAVRKAEAEAVRDIAVADRSRLALLERYGGGATNERWAA